MIGDEMFSKFPLQPNVEPVVHNNTELILNRTWRPGLAITGAENWPTINNADNMLHPFTHLKLSIRIPPRVDPKTATAAVKQLLEKDPPYGAKVAFSDTNASSD